jgi:hypothetical protein
MLIRDTVYPPLVQFGEQQDAWSVIMLQHTEGLMHCFNNVIFNNVMGLRRAASPKRRVSSEAICLARRSNRTRGWPRMVQSLIRVVLGRLG